MKKSLLIFFSTLFFGLAQAQTLHTRTLQWFDKDTSATARSARYPRLHFYGSSPDAQQLPLYTEFFSTSRSAKLEWYSSEPVPSGELSKLKNVAIASDFQLTQEVVHERGTTKLRVTLLPIRKNANGQVERITAFSLSFSDAPGSAAASTLLRSVRPKAVEASNSVLSSGKWVKLRVKKTGVYKLTASMLKGWGFSNPATVSVWSSGCKELPRLNNIAAPDDLAQLPTRLSNGNIFFYAEATNTWYYDKQRQLFRHEQNEYDNAGYVYITASRTAEEMPTMAQVSNATDETDTYDYRDYHERIDTNILRSGRRFFGELFTTSSSPRTINFTIPSLYTPNPEAKLYVCAAAHSIYYRSTYYSITVNGGSENIFTIAAATGDAYMNADTILFSNIPLSSENVAVKMTYYRNYNDDWSVLDFITINARAKLELKSAQLLFRDAKTVGNGNRTQFNLSSTQSNVHVWDVTRLDSVQEMGGIATSGNISFTANSSALREYVAFTEDMAMTPEVVDANMPNQNLHGVQPPDFVIVTHPDFKSQANRVAQMHETHDGMKVLVATTDEVYNEFSSGIPDVSAIRNFMRMFHRKNTTTAPKYLLLFGSGSYVNYINKRGVGLIPSYQSDNSLTSNLSYVSDDFFVLLDDNEYLDDNGMHGALDMAVGRFPVYNTTQANTLASKTEQYYSDLGGDWMSKCIFIADDEDNNIHMTQSERLGNYLLDSFPSYYVNKIYLDDYLQISTPIGPRYPAVTEAISSAVDAGALLINYTGHANDEWLAHEQVLTVSDIQKWDNRNRLPIFVTATCEFSRFDDPSHLSAGEYVLFSSKGGSIAMLSTTRLVYSDANSALNEQFIKDFFRGNTSGKHYRLGEAVQQTKNTTATGVNQLNFSLLGDPALMPNFATLTANTAAVNGTPYPTPDTLKALAHGSVSGSVAQSTLRDTIVVTVFDKEQVKTTLGNGGETPFNYRSQTNILYRGKVSTPGGAFTAKFIVPQDIIPQVGRGKITYVGKAGSTLVAGSNTVPIGGTSANPVVDSTPPSVRMYMNSERWVPGGTVNQSPTFIALLSDSSGINTTGNGVGRDITLKLMPTDKTYTLNTYYTANTDSYTSGRVEFPIPSLAKGKHAATLKVWDVVNNSTEQSVDFVVADEDVFTLNRLLNYPNPFTQKTAFFFEHNRPYYSLDVLIQVYTVTGKLVKTIRYTIPESSSLRSAPIEWDGRDDYGGKLGRGTYLYKAKVRCSSGETTEKLEKLVVLN